jgi:hypothetical protein
MSSNSSSPKDQGEPKDFDKSAPFEDSSDVPVVAVTAELPVHGTNPAADTAPLAAQPDALAPENNVAELSAGGGDTSPTPTPPDFLAPLRNGVTNGVAADEAGRLTPIPESDLDLVSESDEARLATPVGLEGAAADADVAISEGTAEATASALPETEIDGESTSLDASDLVIDGEAEAAAQALEAHLPRRTVQGMPVPPPPMAAAPPAVDEEFLRRVVLPPLPRTPSRPTLAGMPVVPIENNPFDDHTVISAPPSAELLASMAPVAPRAGSHSLPVPGERRRDKPVRLSYTQLAALLILAGVGGGVASGYLRDRPAPTAAVAPERAAPAPTPAPAAAAPAAAAPTTPAVTPTPPAAKPETATAPATPPTPTTAASGGGSQVDASRPTRAAKAGKRARRAKRTAAANPTAPAPSAKKKAWVDPFE